LAGDPFDDLDSTVRQRLHFLRVVGQKADTAHLKIAQDRDCEAEIAAVSIET
jgi:hypothetical protein